MKSGKIMPLIEPLESMLFPFPSIETTSLASKLNQLSLKWQKTARVFYRALSFLVGALLTLSIIWPTYHLYCKDHSIARLRPTPQNKLDIIDSSTVNNTNFAATTREEFFKEGK